MLQKGTELLHFWMLKETFCDHKGVFPMEAIEYGGLAAFACFMALANLAGVGGGGVAIPMIMDRKVDAITAVLTSLRACLTNPLAMFVWGATISATIALSMLPYFLGLIVMGPVMGYATWHAYRAIVPATTESISRG